MTYSIVLFPNKEVQERANSYRKRYDPTYALIPPFIRLKESFTTDENELKKIKAHLQEVASNTSPFSLTFHRVSTFHPTTNVIFLSFQNKEIVENVHNKVLSCFNSHQEEFIFVPHLTIGRDLSDGELKDVVGRLSMMNINETSSFTQIHLIKQHDEGRWKIEQSFDLTGE